MKKENINEKWSKPLAEILKNELKERKKRNAKYNQDDFAKELNISSSTLTQLLKQNRNPSLDSLFSISEALNCSIDYLAGLTHIKNREWDDINKSIQLLSKKTKLSEKALDKIINHISYDEPYLYGDKMWVLNQLICSIGFETFLEKFNNYLAFNYDLEYEKYYDNKIRNILESPKKEILPEADDIRYRVERDLKEYAIHTANLTEYKYQFNIKMADRWKKKMDEYKEKDSSLILEDYETFSYAKQRYEYYESLIATYQNKTELQESMEKNFDNHLKEMEKKNKRLKVKQIKLTKSKENKKNG